MHKFPQTQADAKKRYIWFRIQEKWLLMLPAASHMSSPCIFDDTAWEQWGDGWSGLFPHQGPGPPWQPEPQVGRSKFFKASRVLLGWPPIVLLCVLLQISNTAQSQRNYIHIGRFCSSPLRHNGKVWSECRKDGTLHLAKRRRKMWTVIHKICLYTTNMPVFRALWFFVISIEKIHDKVQWRLCGWSQTFCCD